jgi:hypothetical protein
MKQYTIEIKCDGKLISEQRLPVTRYAFVKVPFVIKKGNLYYSMEFLITRGGVIRPPGKNVSFFDDNEQEITEEEIQS